jgi:serine/threonine protein kinase
MTEAAIGPMEYMAPEVLLGCIVPCPLADMWSAAAVMYFVFVGQSMFGPTPTDRHMALEQIFKVLGTVRAPDDDELSLLPHWMPVYAEPDAGIFWEGRLLKAAGPGADQLLRLMLAFSVARRFLA